MSTTETDVGSPGVSHDEHTDHDAHDDHKPDGYYVKIAVILAIITGLEVGLSYAGLEGLVLLVPLFALMAIKFVMVAAFFMHLRFDNRLLSQVFYAGLLLAIGVYIAALATFEVFS